MRALPRVRLERWSGADFKEALEAASLYLEARAGQLNDLNVFPVPDGDTGTNLSLTMQAVVGEVNRSGSFLAGKVAGAAAYGALMGARGNSGVILSQILAGIAEVLESCDSFTARELAIALEAGTRKAYACVAQPTEGTILTVCRETATAAREAAAEGGDLLDTLKAMCRAAHDAVQETPNILPVLRDAGVVDAGGLGFEMILDAMLRVAAEGSGDAKFDRPEQRSSRGLPARPVEGDTGLGYCTEFLLKGPLARPEQVRDYIDPLGSSLVVAGSPGMVRVHVHTDSPGRVLEIAAGLGSLHRIKIENMQEQYENRSAFLRAHQTVEVPPKSKSIGVIAVASGNGFQHLFRQLGAVVIDGGETMNPTTGDILLGIKASVARSVIVLPNNRNMLLNARQAGEASGLPLVVVPTESMPQGLSALLAFQQDASLEQNASEMERAARGTTTIEVARAIRDAQYNGLKVRQGQAIGLLNGDLSISGDSLSEVALEALARANATDCDLIAVYYGADTSGVAAQQLATEIRRRYQRQEVEVQPGGQPLYDYIISLE